MPSLCVEYLHGRASHAEWPASPDRLLQAMLATAYAIGQHEPLLPLLEKSCCGQKPAITAPDGPTATVWHTSVPVAFMPSSGNDKKYDSRAIVKQSARHLPERTQVWYHWDLPEELAELVHNIRHVGKREDLVRCWLDPAPPVPNLLPMAAAEIFLAAPQPSRIKQLQECHRIAAKAPAAPAVGYGSPVEPSAWGELLLKRPGAVWPANEAWVLARQFSRALLAKFDEGRIPPWVHQRHGEPYIPHLACVAVPEISERRPHLRRLAGVGVVLPKTEEAQTKLIRRMLDGIADMPWDDENLHSLQDRHWLGPARAWATVTPVVFPFHGKRPGDLERQLADLLGKQGYPPPETVEVTPASPLKGIPPAALFFRRNPNKPIFHARVRWQRRQAGPVLIGLEAHYGLGLFTPCRQQD